MLAKFFLFNEQEERFLLFYNKIVFFIISNLMFYTIAINAHYNLKTNSFMFGISLLFSLGVSIVFSQIFQLKNIFIFGIYTITYIIFSILGLFEFYIIFLLLMNLFIFLSIKSFHWLIPNNKYEQTIHLMNYVIMDDFNHEIAFHYYNLPFKRTDNNKRSLKDELFVMQKYNSMLLFKNKITEKNFDDYKNIKDLTIYKSALLITYKIILDYCKQGYETIETPPISFKLHMKEDNDLLNDNEQYTCEFKIDLRNLKTLYKEEKDNEKAASNIKNGINELQSIAKNNKMGIKFKHGVKDEYYVIRLIINLSKSNHVGDDVSIALNQINQHKLEQLKSINMTKSSGLTTVYGETNVQTEETIDDLRFK